MWQSKYFPTPTLQIVPGEYPRGYPGELKPVSATAWGNTRGVPKKDVPTTGHIWGYSLGTICSVGVGKYFDCHISTVVTVPSHKLQRSYDTRDVNTRERLVF